MYDAIVVGARCAGSPTAMLLARKGYRVLLLDRAAFPSDTMSTHALQRTGVGALLRWGLLDRLVASGCPPIRTTTFDFGFTTISPPRIPVPGVEAVYCPRRTVLDKLLVDAAVAAGAELRERFSVQELLAEDGRVSGVRGRTAAGATVEARARIVVGADGLRSVVARAVDAPVYHRRPSYNCSYYSYFSGVPLDGNQIAFRHRRMMFAFPTHDNLACLGIGRPREEFHALRSDIDGNFLKTFDLAPGLGERVRGGRREERWVGTAAIPNFFRQPFGRGWALVGDAGYHKDPAMGWGISDAFRDAELLADALDAGWCGRAPLDEALAGYEQQRNAATMRIYEMTCRLAELHPPTPELVQMFAPPTR